jgi:Na+/citrate or Na+/malate symporter
VTCGGGSADCERIITFSSRTMSRRWPSIMVHIFCCLLLVVTVAHAVNTSPSDILTMVIFDVIIC